jgi:lipopolysaccharide export system permease protein
MGIVTRYVVREVGVVFVVTLLVLTLFLVGVGVVKESMQQGLGARQVFELIPFVIPQALLFAIPGTILFAASAVYGRMSGGNEIVALKSLGINPLAVVIPTLVFATLLSLVTVWLNDVATSWGYAGIRQVVVDGVEEIAYGMLRAQHRFDHAKFAIVVKEVDEHRLVLPEFLIRSAEGIPDISVSADEAEMFAAGAGTLRVKFTNGRLEAGPRVFEFPDTIEREIQLFDPDAENSQISPSHVNLGSLANRLANDEVTLAIDQEKITAQAGYWLAQGDFNALANADWRAAQDSLNNLNQNVKRILVEAPRRWATGFSCLCFAIVGIPVAIRMRTADLFTSFFACFLPILLAYYPLLAWSLDRAKAGAVSPYMVFAGNAALTVWGLWALRKVLRY